MEVMVVRHFEIEVVIEMKRLFFSKLVLPRFVIFLRSLEEDMNKTLRIKNGRDEEESMGMKEEEDEWFKVIPVGTSIEMVKDAEKENSKKFRDPAGGGPINTGRSQIYWGAAPCIWGAFSGDYEIFPDFPVF
ncbi:hypothetical protein Tco_0962521 [Tanacetum coccineum]